MASNGFEIGTAFGVVSGLVALAMSLVLVLPTLLAGVVAHVAASLRLESICGRRREDRKDEDGRAGCDCELIAAGLAGWVIIRGGAQQTKLKLEYFIIILPPFVSRAVLAQPPHSQVQAASCVGHRAHQVDLHVSPSSIFA